MQIIIILVIMIVLIALSMTLRTKNVNNTREILAATEGKHSADFKTGPVKGFIAENKLYFQIRNQINIHVVDLKAAKTVGCYRMKGTYWVNFSDENKKKVGDSIEFSMTMKSVNEFYDFIRANADWIEVI